MGVYPGNVTNVCTTVHGEEVPCWPMVPVTTEALALVCPPPLDTASIPKRLADKTDGIEMRDTGAGQRKGRCCHGAVNRATDFT